MATPNQMRDPLKVGKAIRAQLENEIPSDLPLDRDFKVSLTALARRDICWIDGLLDYSPFLSQQEGTDYTITDHVNQLHKQLCPDARSLELCTSLINHLHAFARETKPTHKEWLTAIKYLTRAGKESTEFKNELILLSDCLGFSALLDELAHPKPEVSNDHLAAQSICL